VACAVLVVSSFQVFIEGDVIIHAGEFSQGMYFISSGEVEIWVDGVDRPIATLGQGAFFGTLTSRTLTLPP
jgi:CRP-like cAMP-binding protein